MEFEPVKKTVERPVEKAAASIVELIQAPMQYHAPKLIGHGSFGPLSFGRLQTSGGGGGYQP